MAVTPDDIAVELGRPISEVSAEQAAQWQSWIDRTYRIIGRRLGDLGLLDQETLDDVVTLAVARHARLPGDGAASVSEQVGVDDGSAQETRRWDYRGTDAGIEITDEWWGWLTGTAARGAWTHDTLAGRREGYRWVAPDLWVPLP